MKGNISEEALFLYGQLVAEKLNLDFSEGDTYDFTRCVRPDGSAYGTKGTCRKGTEGAKAVEKAAPKAAPKEKVAKVTAAPKAPKVTKTPEAPKAPSTTKVGKDPKEAYAALMKKQQEMVQKGDIAGAMKLNEKIKAASAKVQESPEAKAQAEQLKAQGETRAKSESDFKAAQEKRLDGQLAANLNSKDKKAIEDYTKETMGQSARSYDNMNGCLRFPPTCDNKKESGKFIKEFDSALSKLPKNEDGNEFFRGVQVRPGQTQELYKALLNAKPGTRMKDPGYGSYSAERKQAEFFTDRNKPNIIFVTKSKSMTPINAYSAIRSENEAILPRNTEQTIRKVTKEGKNLIVELD